MFHGVCMGELFAMPERSGNLIESNRQSGDTILGICKRLKHICLIVKLLG